MKKYQKIEVKMSLGTGITKNRGKSVSQGNAQEGVWDREVWIQMDDRKDKHICGALQYTVINYFMLHGH